jgi:hypothetical protein
MAKKKTKKTKSPRKKILCKVDMDGDLMIVYEDQTWRWRSENWSNVKGQQWRLCFFEETQHHMFFYRDNEMDEWRTEYHSLHHEEIMLGETIARAVADREMHKILKGKSDGMS